MEIERATSLIYSYAVRRYSTFLDALQRQTGSVPMLYHNLNGVLVPTRLLDIRSGDAYEDMMEYLSRY